MERSQHCEFCDHQQVSMMTGTTCGLTRKKPDFDTTCSTIALNKKFDDGLIKAHLGIKVLEQKRSLTYLYFYVFLTIGSGVVLGACYASWYLWRIGVISVIPFIVLAAGLSIVAVAFGPFNKFRYDLSAGLERKQRIDNLVRLYGIDYSLDLNVGKEIHGHQEYTADLKFWKKPNV